MSASHEWEEWHLTPVGWVKGSTCVDFAGETEKPVPPDRVLTKRHVEHLSDSHAKMSRYWEEEWRSTDVMKVKTLLAKHGDIEDKR